MKIYFTVEKCPRGASFFSQIGKTYKSPGGALRFAKKQKGFLRIVETHLQKGVFVSKAIYWEGKIK